MRVYGEAEDRLVVVRDLTAREARDLCKLASLVNAVATGPVLTWLPRRARDRESGLGTLYARRLGAVSRDWLQGLCIGILMGLRHGRGQASDRPEQQGERIP